MEELLEKYLKGNGSNENVYIDYYHIDGAVCSVKYFTDKERNYREYDNINIWQMLLFLNSK